MLFQTLIILSTLVTVSHSVMARCNGPCVIPKDVSCTDLIAATKFFDTSTCCSLSDGENGLCVLTIASDGTGSGHCAWEPIDYVQVDGPYYGVMMSAVTDVTCPESAYDPFGSTRTPTNKPTSTPTNMPTITPTNKPTSTPTNKP